MMIPIRDQDDTCIRNSIHSGLVFGPKNLSPLIKWIMINVWGFCLGIERSQRLNDGRHERGWISNGKVSYFIRLISNHREGVKVWKNVTFAA